MNKVYKNGNFAIMIDDDGIIKASGLNNVLCCDPDGIIEDYELVEVPDDSGICWEEGATINDVLTFFKITKRQLSYRFDIPYSTIIKWTRDVDDDNHRDAPPYVIQMIIEILKHDRA